MNKSLKTAALAAAGCMLIIGGAWMAWNIDFESDTGASKQNAAAPESSSSVKQTAAVIKKIASTDKPGLYLADGTPHKLHTANPVNGKTHNVLDYGADPSDSSHDDTAAIHAAMKAAQAGDEVYLPNGIYNLISTVSMDKASNIELKSGVNLRGESQEGTVLRSYFDNKSGSNTRVIKALGLQNITISNLTISSSFNGKYPTDRVENSPDRGGPITGIYIEDAASKGSQHITIDRVTVEKYQRMGVRVSRSNDVVVRNSLFRNATDLGGGGAGYGVVFQGTPKVDRKGFDNDSYFNVVENSRFEGPYIRHGVLIQYYSHHNAVRDNQFVNTALDAIDLHGEMEYLNEITNNKAEGILTGAAIGLGNTGGTAPSNHSASGPGNYIHDNIITNSRNGITVSMGSAGTRIENNTIQGSKVKNGTGITILNGPDTIIRGNKISGNLSEGFWGIVLQHDNGDKNAQFIGAGDPSGVQIVGNTVIGNSNGIKISAGTNITLKDNENRDNAGDNLIDLTQAASR